MPLDGKNRLLQAIAVRDTLAERVLFFRDPDGVELLYEPGYVVRQILERGYFQDDCDDYTTLAASLGKAAGLRARFVAMRFFDESQPLTHVYAELLTERGWLPIDRKASIPFPPELVIYKGFVEV
jgi:transglutaminase-like putative cysteine protease